MSTPKQDDFSTPSIYRHGTVTVNIWSHLLGAMSYSMVPLYYFPELKSRYNRAGSTNDVVFLIILFFGVTLCVIFSTLYVSVRFRTDWRKLILTQFPRLYES